MTTKHAIIRYASLYWPLPVFCLVGLYLASMCVLVRHYGPSRVWKFGDGTVALYWGGDDELRNSRIYNAGEWPLKPDTHFAGSDPGDMEWETYGPDMLLSRRWFADRIQYSGICSTFGLQLPQWNIGEEGEASVIVPLGIPAVAVTCGSLIFLIWRRWSHRRLHRA